MLNCGCLFHGVRIIYLFIYLFIEAGLIYSPVNRTGSPQGSWSEGGCALWPRPNRELCRTDWYASATWSVRAFCKLIEFEMSDDDHVPWYCLRLSAVFGPDCRRCPQREIEYGPVVFIHQARSHRIIRSFCLFVCLSVCLSVCLPACLPVCLSACLSVFLSVFLSVCVCVCVCLSVRLSVCVCVCVCLSVWLLCILLGMVCCWYILLTAHSYGALWSVRGLLLK